MTMTMTMMMMQRCILEHSRRRSLQQISTQASYFLSSRKGFSSSSRRNVAKGTSHSPGKAAESNPHFLCAKKDFSASSRQNVVQKPPGSAGKSPEPEKSNVGRWVVRGVLISGAVAATVYQYKYLYQPEVKETVDFKFGKKDDKDSGGLGEEVIASHQYPSVSTEDEGRFEEKGEAHLDISHVSDQTKVEGESQVDGGLNETHEVDSVSVQQTENELHSSSQADVSSDDRITETSPGEVIDKKEGGDAVGNIPSSINQNEVVNAVPNSEKTKAMSEELEIKAPSVHHITPQDQPETLRVNDAGTPSSLIDLYHLGEKDGQSYANSLDGRNDDSIPHSQRREDSVGMSEGIKGGYIIDFLEAIHAAENRQAELDSRILVEERRILKDKHEKELKDARDQELMYAEKAALLDKELNKEITTAAATVKTLQEKAEENLKIELERKDNEAEMRLKKVKELAQAELAAAIASEKASHIEKMAEADLHINALCMAFYARSEESRQSHSVHKLALGALALEDALAEGLPIQSEISTLHKYLEGIDKDSLLNLVLSSLPEETRRHGAETKLQLHQKFDALKPTLRHYSLIPPGGGGILTHTVAQIATGLKVKENDRSGDGIESTINRVETFLVEGKLIEAADALEVGVSGSEAEKLVGEWVKRVRNRAITEQALSLIQSYATSISVT